MRASDFFFYFLILFLVGVASASFGASTGKSLLISVILFLISFFCFVYIEDKKFLLFSFLFFGIFAGNFYYQVWDYFYFGDLSIRFGEETTISGVVSSSVSGDSLYKYFNVKSENGEILSVRVKDFRDIEYGDSIKLKGEIQKTPDNFKYLKSKKVVGRMVYPEIVSIEESKGFNLKRELFKFRDRFSSVFRKLFPKEEASLLSGILLGKDSAGFSKDFTEKMKNSGTTHIVALSGYNIMVLVNIIFLVLSFFISRRYGIWVAMISVFVFVIMTGAEASVVRAAIMWLVAISAEIFSRIYNFTRSTVLTAFVMVLVNPFVLAFDAGFILSFASLFGIMYLSTLLPRPANIGEALKSILNIFYETFSAQVMVLPILILIFGKVSAVSLLSNVLVLPIIPILMGAGFLNGIFGIIHPAISNIISKFINPVVSYVVSIIDFFGSMPAVKVSAGWWFAVLYYAFIFLFIIKLKNRNYNMKYDI